MHAFVEAVGQHRTAGGGFTLIELMTVVAIAAILLTLGVPAMSEFVADQRVRTTASDIVAEIAFARAKAIENSRPVYIEKTGALWSNGWRIYVDLDRSGDMGLGEELKRFDGFPPTGTMYLCIVTNGATDPTANLIFRPDGRLVRNAAQPNDGIYVVDTMGDTGSSARNKIRGLLFGLSGRVTTVKMNGEAAPCIAS